MAIDMFEQLTSLFIFAVFSSSNPKEDPPPPSVRNSCPRPPGPPLVHIAENILYEYGGVILNAFELHRSCPTGNARQDQQSRSLRPCPIFGVLEISGALRRWMMLLVYSTQARQTATSVPA